jgi:hypothetical protein
MAVYLLLAMLVVAVYLLLAMLVPDVLEEATHVMMSR